MNRTLIAETLAGGPSPGADRLLVLPGFEHPERGRVRCPAASALAADLAERLGSGGSGGSDRPDGSDRAAETVTEALTYLDRDGRALGLAVAVHRDDHEAVAAVRDVLGEWRAAMRTRRVLVAGMVHEGQQEACRHAEAASTSVVDFVYRGDTVILIGDPAADATRLLAERVRQTGGVAALVGAPALAAREFGDPDRLSFVVVPGTRVEVATSILSALRARYPRLRGQHPDEFCYHASDLFEAFRSVAAASDRVLLLTGRGHDRPAEVVEKDPFAREAVRLLAAHGVEWRFVSDPVSLRPSDLGSAIGLISLSSASAEDVDAVLGLLGGLGPLSVRLRTMRTAAYGGGAGVPGAEEPSIRLLATR